MGTTRFIFRISKLIVSALGLTILTSCQGTPVLESTLTPSSTPIPVGYAGNPVTANNQWKPLVQTFDGVDMVLVPVGCFMMGTTDEQLKAASDILHLPLDWMQSETDTEQPASKVCFDHPFWIDRVEVTNAEFSRLGGQSELDNRWVGDYLPRANITRAEASTFCQRRGARLPTESEWEYAARGPDDLLFPWGNTFVAENVTGGEIGRRHAWDVGSRPDGVSWVGALDMAGNLAEWVSSQGMPYPYNASDGREDGSARNSFEMIVRGGSWLTMDTISLRTASREKPSFGER
jgi:iron(II)-dependent oxidoreductase